MRCLLRAAALVAAATAASDWQERYRGPGYFVLPRVFSGERLERLRAAAGAEVSRR